MIDRLRRISFFYRSLVAREPALWLLYQPYLLWGQMKRKAAGHNPREGLLLPDTELVIDGFQGSANSFAVSAFVKSQTQPVQLMHHRHAPVLIIRAIEQKIPVLLTIREPFGTVLSVTSRWSHITVTQALQSYIGFYSKLKPYSSHYVVSTFDLTTQHLDRIIEAVNRNFETHFDLVDMMAVKAEQKSKISNHQQLENRQTVRERKKKEFALEKNTRLLQKAQDLYQYFEILAQNVQMTNTKEC